MAYAIVDVETTIFAKGHPYSARNRLCYVGIRIAGVNHLFSIEYDNQPYGPTIDRINQLLATCDLVVGFNLKFDLAWLRRYGIPFPGRVWDCQLAEFVLDYQRTAYPSLDGTCAKYGLARKLSTVPEYWERKIDTPDIPRPVLEEYLAGDLESTDQLYQHQLAKVPNERMGNLIRLQNEDLLVLLDMEFNGIRFDVDAMARDAERTQREIVDLNNALCEYTGGWPYFNFDSGDHLSCLLYGGTITVDVAEPYEHTYKGGAKAGQTVTRNRWRTETRTYPRLCEPLDDTKLQKDGYWSTAEDVLSRLRGAKPLIKLLLRRAELEKLLSTYLVGIPNHYSKYDWADGLVHGTFNQCRVVTGRLSSEKPNLQNFPEVVNAYICTRF